jgi:transposase
LEPERCHNLPTDRGTNCATVHRMNISQTLALGRKASGTVMHTQLHAFTTCQSIRTASRACHPKNMNTHPEQAALIGMDWGDTRHAYAVLRRGQVKPDRGSIAATPEALHEWLCQLREEFGGRQVLLAIEHGRNSIIGVLAEHPWLTIYPINPAMSARFRLAFTPSGAKDDQPDAAIILELLRQHRDKLRPLILDEPLTRELDAYNRARRGVVDECTRVTNRLTAVLKSCFPQALVLAGEQLAAPMAVDFLRRFPSLAAVKKATPSRLREFYRKHNVRSAERIEERVGLVAKAQPATSDRAVLVPAALQIQQLVDLIEQHIAHIKAYDQVIAETYAKHPKAKVFSSFPGAGKSLAPRLAAAFGDRPERYPEPAAFHKHAGLAPVMERSGSKQWVHWRWAAPKFVRQSLIEWAAQTIKYSQWASSYYHRLKAAGKSHHAILRSLAFKWTRILWRCWTDNTQYDEERYLAALASHRQPTQKNSPLTP